MNELQRQCLQEIERDYQRVQSSAGQAIDGMVDTFNALLDCGIALSNLRDSMRHSAFAAAFPVWLEQGLLSFDLEQANSCMRFAKHRADKGYTTREKLPEDLKHVSQAMLDLNFLPSPERPTPEPPESKKPDWPGAVVFKHVDRAIVEWRKEIEHSRTKPADWPEHVKLSYKQAVKPLIDLYNELEA